MAEIKLVVHTDHVLKTLNDMIVQRMQKACIHLKNEVNKTLSGDRTGRTYKVPGTKHKYYTASAPGEPPAVATGRLRKSIKYKVEGSFKQCTGYVGTDVKYASILERGGTIPGHTETVREHVRTMRIKTKQGYIVKQVTVRAHSRNVPAKRIAARPFLRPTMEREREKIKQILSGA